MKYVIVEGDSTRCLRSIKSNFFQSCITSPPYYRLKKYGRLKDEIDSGTVETYKHNLNIIFRQVYRVLKDTGIFCLNVDRGVNDSVDPWEILALAKRSKFILVDTIIWEYNRQPGSHTKHLLHRYEPIFLLAKSHDYRLYFNELDNNFVWDTWKVYYKSVVTSGVASFPEKLAENLILLTTQYDDWILEPFLGTGTTMRKAIVLRRNCFGIEVNGVYADNAHESCKPYLTEDDFIKRTVQEF